ncbi:MAG: hypothetical protein IPK20_13630 [Betaproteobacteria bacterium]|nr:hypothetical protein [Betaproteobacteria bacterium]
MQKALAETDPRSKAKEVSLSAQRIEELVKRVDAAEVWVSDAAIAKLKELDEAVLVAAQAEKVAAEQFRAGGSLLPGTGEQVWKAMFDAARRFSTESAYEGHPFPHVKPGAHCVLCQQPIDSAGDRMKRFADFVQSDAAKVAAAKREQLGAAVRKIEAARLVFDLDPALSSSSIRSRTGCLIRSASLSRVSRYDAAGCLAP